MEFCRKEYWSGLPFLSPGAFPDPGIEPTWTKDESCTQEAQEAGGEAVVGSLSSDAMILVDPGGGGPGPVKPVQVFTKGLQNPVLLRGFLGRGRILFPSKHAH